MTNYFIRDGGNEVGPLTMRQLKLKSINKDTLIWFAGLEEWTKAEQVCELRILFRTNVSPSPFSKNRLNKMWNNLVKPNFKKTSYHLNFSRQRKNHF